MDIVISKAGKKAKYNQIQEEVKEDVKEGTKGVVKEDTPVSVDTPEEGSSEEEKKEEKVGEAKEETKEAVKEDAPVKEVKKGDARMPKSTKSPKPGECASCGKPIAKRLWYYRNSEFFCTKKCYKRKLEVDKKKAAEEAVAAK